MHRASFVMGSVAAFLARPSVASADDVSAPAKAALKPRASDVTSLPEHRPIAWKMDVLDGPPFDLAAYRGKVVFVNIFATWCATCRAGQPAVVTFSEQHPDDTIVIGMNYKEQDSDVRAYRKTFDIAYPIAMDRRGTLLPTVYKDERVKLPMTIVFRPDGTVSAAWAGDRTLAWLEHERDAALAGPAA
jgi:thiol-disulfide isomerase/thioredoxin